MVNSGTGVEDTTKLIKNDLFLMTWTISVPNWNIFDSLLVALWPPIGRVRIRPILQYLDSKLEVLLTEDAYNMFLYPPMKYFGDRSPAKVVPPP